MNKKITKQLINLPSWILSMICALAILWLTLFPKPLGDISPQLFQGADKVVHAIMFGGLSLCILTDIWRKGNCNKVSASDIVIAGIISVAFGGLIEIIQNRMEVGRSGDILDFVADSIGVVIVTLGWGIIENIYGRKSK